MKNYMKNKVLGRIRPSDSILEILAREFARNNGVSIKHWRNARQRTSRTASPPLRGDRALTSLQLHCNILEGSLPALSQKS